MKQILNPRQRKLLGILNSQQDTMRGADIAEILGVSDRTIRSDILELNDTLKDYHVQIIAVRGKGYQLSAGNDEELQQLIYSQNCLITQKDRVREIIARMIQQTGMLPLGELQDELYISRSTLDNDIKYIRIQYSDNMPHIQLIRNKNSIRFEENEWKKRFIMKLLLIEDWNYNCEAAMQLQHAPVNPDEVKTITETLEKLLCRTKIQLNEYDHISFLFSVVVACSRIQSGYGLPNYQKRGPSDTMQAVDQMCEELERRLSVHFNSVERYALDDELAHRRQFNGEILAGQYWKQFGDSIFAIIVTDVLTKIDTIYHLNLQECAELRSELLFTLRSQYRNPFHAGIRQPEVLRGIKTSYPFALELSSMFCQPVFHATGMKLTENNLVELAANLAAKLESEAAKRTQGGVRITLVSHLNAAGSKVMMAQLGAFFGNRVQLSGPYSIYECHRIDSTSCDLVLTTAKLNHLNVEKPVLLVSPIVTKNDLEQINFYLEQQKYQNLYPKLFQPFGAFFAETRFEMGVSASSKQEVLKHMSEQMQRQGVVGDDYFEALCAQEQIMSTAFADGFAIPHAFAYSARQSAVSVCFLKYAVEWDGIPVQAVFLITLRPEERYCAAQLYSRLPHILRRLAATRTLEQIHDYKGLQRSFQSFNLLMRW